MNTLENNKPTVIYHSADFDGIFCREIARKFLPAAELIGWDFGDTPLAVPAGLIYVLDLPVDRVFGFKFLGGTASIDEGLIFEKIRGRIIWIDHHKTAIDSHPKDIPGYRIDGVAACRLAWQFFTNYFIKAPDGFGGIRPTKEYFLDREIPEPCAVRLAGEYDIWDKRDERAELFQHGLRSRELAKDDWDSMLSQRKATIDEIESLILVGHKDILNPDGTHVPPVVWQLLEAGKVLQYAKTQENASIINDIGFTLQWEGLTLLACNAARYNSHLFTAGLKPEHDACLGFKWTGKTWSVSLYHAPGKEHHDLSLIAVKNGGGGHRGACGFCSSSLPFLPQ